MRVHGEALPDMQRFGRGEIDLGAVENGGGTVATSDQHYGAPRNLLMPYRPKNMGDGWETKRRRGPGHDWVILKLGVPGTICRVVVDTAHFKGNYPDSCSLEAADAQETAVNATNAQNFDWQEVLPQTKLKANHRHEFGTLQHSRVATHVRFRIYPDGGVSRLRIFGRPGRTANVPKALQKLNRLSRQKAVKAFLDCCGSNRWAEQLAGRRPFSSTAELLSVADTIWSEMKENDWMEAFRHHPPIGGKRPTAKTICQGEPLVRQRTVGCPEVFDGSPIRACR